MCEFVGDYFGPLYFSYGDTLPQKNNFGSKHSSLISHIDLKKDGAQLLLSKSYESFFMKVCEPLLSYTYRAIFKDLLIIYFFFFPFLFSFLFFLFHLDSSQNGTLEAKHQASQASETTPIKQEPDEESKKNKVQNESNTINQVQSSDNTTNQVHSEGNMAQQVHSEDNITNQVQKEGNMSHQVKSEDNNTLTLEPIDRTGKSCSSGIAYMYRHTPPPQDFEPG